jgi:hypothetical protein
MKPLSRQSHKLVSLNQDLVIADVQLDVEKRTLTLPLEFVGDYVVYPECGVACSMEGSRGGTQLASSVCDAVSDDSDDKDSSLLM